MTNDRPVILLAAHGERGGAGNNARLARLVGEVAAFLPQADVGSVLVSVDGIVAAALEACGTRPVIGLPMLFSDGFFYTDRLVPHFVKANHRLAPPMAFWPGFAPLLADNLALRLMSHSADPRVVLVAHGSKKPGRSAQAALRVAAALQARYGRIETGFLEEAPFAADVIARIEAPYAIVGLFLGDGLHGGEDFDMLAATAPVAPAAAFTAGEAPGLASLAAAQARAMLADVWRS